MWNLSDDSLREKFRTIDSETLRRAIADGEEKLSVLPDDYVPLDEEEIAQIVSEYLNIKVPSPSTQRYPIETHERFAYFAVGSIVLGSGLAALGLRRRTFIRSGLGVVGLVIGASLGKLSFDTYNREFHDGGYDAAKRRILIPEELSGPWYDVIWGHEYIHHVQQESEFKGGILAREGHARGLEPIFCKSPAHQRVHQELSLRDLRMAQKLGDRGKAIGHVVLSIASNGKLDFYRDLLNTNSLPDSASAFDTGSPE